MEIRLKRKGIKTSNYNFGFTYLKFSNLQKILEITQINKVTTMEIIDFFRFICFHLQWKFDVMSNDKINPFHRKRTSTRAEHRFYRSVIRLLENTLLK